jgi:hypothetical protein
MPDHLILMRLRQLYDVAFLGSKECLDYWWALPLDSYITRPVRRQNWYSLSKPIKHSGTTSRGSMKRWNAQPRFSFASQIRIEPARNS